MRLQVGIISKYYEENAFTDVGAIAQLIVSLRRNLKDPSTNPKSITFFIFFFNETIQSRLIHDHNTVGVESSIVKKKVLFAVKKVYINLD